MKPNPLKSKLKNILEKSKKQTKLDAPIENPEPVKPRVISKPKTSVKDKIQKTPKLSALQQKMQQKLAGSKFRWINETLYTTKSDSSYKLFQEQPELFEIYHQGFHSQVQKWPVNPVDIIIKELRQSKPPLVIADMGCGEAQIAKELHDIFTIHSFDLISGNEFTTAADISNVPLKNNSVDVVIFCLSLMGTNFVDFLKEAKRILRKNGILMIAEVISRMDNVLDFIKGVEAIGYELQKKDSSNKMFVMLNFTVNQEKQGEMPILKPCIYKRR